MWDDKEKFLWFCSAVPPVLVSFWIFQLLRHGPGLLESLASVVPGLQKPEFKDGMACLRLEASADIIQTMNNVVHLHHAMMTSELQALGVDHRILAEGGAAASRLTRRFARRLDFSRHNLEDSDDVEQPQRRKRQDPCLGHVGSLMSLRSMPEDPDLEDGGRQEQSSKQEASLATRGVWVNVKHLASVFLIPLLFVTMYFWDAAVIQREASVDFPLSNCMGDSMCFYITQDYALWRWPEYKKLDCDVMTEKTVKSESGFYYTPPKDAQFYKCYTVVFTPQNLIQATGDVVALMAMNTLIILYFCVDFSLGVRGTADGDSTAQAASRKQLICKRRWVCIKQVVFAVVGVFSSFLVPKIYGKWTNQFEGYLGLPGVCLFAVILLNCRRETLGQRIAELQKEESDASESSSSEDGGGGSPSAPAAAAAPRGSPSRAAAAGQQPLLDVPGSSSGYQPIALAPGLPPPVARSAGDVSQLAQVTGLLSGGRRDSANLGHH